MRKILLGSLIAGAALLAPLAIGTASAAAPAAVPQSQSAVLAYPAWAPNTWYAVGARVTYSGKDYEAIQAHTSLTGWEPPNVPALWRLLAGSSPSASPSTRPPTSPSPSPTASPSASPSPSPSPTKSPTPPPPGGKKVLGYFADWGVYGRQYFVKNIVTSGSAAKLTHINYAFGNVTNGQCAIGDSYADYDMAYTAANSVDGKADTWDNPNALRGAFNQLRKLKAQYPHIKVLYSFGGWTWSGGFGQAAANPAAFANSCYNLLKDPRWADVFDGIDIDWEYPNACGLSCDSSGAAAFKNLMAALRAKFGSNYLVTAAITADGTNGGKIDAADYGGAAQYVDWYNVMTYDYFGAWAAQGPTAPHSALTSYSGIPTAGFYSDAAIQKLKSKGVPASKLLLGIGFYGRGWTGVTQAAPGGTATGAAPGTYEAGIEDYKVLKNSCPATGTVAGTAYAKCGSNWWSYDTPATIGGKMTYAKNQGLGGAFFWEFSGDTANGELITSMSNGLK
ncbi:glycosyl hydrolase family 18 protein [Microbispora sp. NPDC004025]